MKEVTGLLVMDVDGTLIQQEGIDLLAQEAGVGQKVAGIRDLYLSENFGADGSHAGC